MGHDVRALALLDEALLGWRKAAGEPNARLIRPLLVQSRVYTQLQRHEQAVASATEALALIEATGRSEVVTERELAELRARVARGR